MQNPRNIHPLVASAAVATAANLVLFAAGRASGTRFEVVDGATTSAVTAAHVVTASILPFVIGAGLAHLGRRVGRPRVVEVLAVVFTLASLGGPLTMGVDTRTRASLAVMHVVVGAAFFVAARAVRPTNRSTRARVGSPTPVG